MVAVVFTSSSSSISLIGTIDDDDDDEEEEPQWWTTVTDAAAVQRDISTCGRGNTTGRKASTTLWILENDDCKINTKIPSSSRRRSIMGLICYQYI